jgi:hypothetical protein
MLKKEWYSTIQSLRIGKTKRRRKRNTDEYEIEELLRKTYIWWGKKYGKWELQKLTDKKKLEWIQSEFIIVFSRLESTNKEKKHDFFPKVKDNLFVKLSNFENLKRTSNKKEWAKNFWIVKKYQIKGWCHNRKLAVSLSDKKRNQQKV